MPTSSRKVSLRVPVLIACVVFPLLLLLALTLPLQAGSVFYAAPSDVGSGNCGSWGNACTLSKALLLASGSPGSEIWLLAGVHKPTTVTTERTATFFVPDGVSIYGGFTGSESVREERDWQNNLTILSGDIDSNDLTDSNGVVTSTANITGTNSYHVLLGGAAGYTAVLDGFTVTAGFADGPYSGFCDLACGGGMYNNNGQVTIDNVTFSGNYAVHTGGGMYNIYGSPIMSGTAFFNNQSDQGGGLALRRSASVLTNTTFSGNAASYGGGVYVVESTGATWSGTHALDNVYISGNMATSHGGGIYNSAGTVTLVDVTFANNEASQDGGGLYTYGSAAYTTTLSNVVFIENTAVTGRGGGMRDAFGQAIFTVVTFDGNVAGDCGGGLYTDNGSATLSGSTFDNNESSCGGGMATHDGTSSLSGVLFSGNSTLSSGSYDGGGMYIYYGQASLSNVTFEDNTATRHGGGLFTGNTASSALTATTFISNSADYGGGMANAGSSTSLTNTMFISNTAICGGGVYNYSSGSHTLSGVTFEGNVATSHGGGLCNAVSTALENVSFVNNTAVYGGGFYNGYNTGEATLLEVSFSGNSAEFGGGFYNLSGSAALSTVTFSNNAATFGDGGGMYSEEGPASLNDVTFESNTATQFGGGLFNRSATVTVTATTFITNDAPHGGGMTNFDGSANITNTLFSGNTAISGGGLKNQFGGSITLSASTFAGNQASETGGGMYVNNPAVLDEVTFTGNTAYDGGGLYAILNEVFLADVVFEGNIATRNGGGLETHSASATLTATTFISNSADYGGGMANAGSSTSLTNTMFISNTAISGGGVFNFFDGSSSLSAITFTGNQASGAGGGMYNEISALLENVSFSNNEAYDGGGLYNYGSPGIATLLDVTFSDNIAEYGGGMLDLYGPAALSDVLFQGNRANSYGGGLYENHASAMLTNVRFIDNLSQAGGGLAAYDSSPTLINVLFQGNSASTLIFPHEDSGHGSGVFNTAVSNPTLINATFSGNQAEVDGGAMYNRSSSNPLIDNSIFWGDTPQEFNGDGTGTLTINYSNVAGGCPAGAVCSQVIISDPFFVDPPGGDLRLLPGSPSIDAGDNSVITTTTDLSGGPRFINIPGSPDTGLGSPPLVDMGAYEANFVDAALIKTVAPATYEPGTAITFTLAFSNGGSITAANVTVSDEVPWYLTAATWNSSGAAISDTGLLPPYIWSVQDMAPGQSAVITLSGVLTAPLAGGTYTNTAVIAVDDDAATANNTSTLSFDVPNLAPFVTSVPVTLVTQDNPYTYSISAADLNGDMLTISAPTKPDWLALTDHGDGTATLSGTPDSGDVGDHPVLLRVIDGGGLMGEQSFTITVANVNDAPFFISSPVTAATQDLIFNYSITTDDPDLIWGATLTITAPTKPSWLMLTDNGDGTATLSGTPDNSDVGDHPVLLRVIDGGGLMGEQSFTITVANVNDAPVFTSAPLTSATNGVLYSYSVTSDDPDLIWGDVLTITAMTKPAWLTLTDDGDGTATLSGLPRAIEIGTHAVTLRVTDSDGLTDTQSFTITVRGLVYLPFVVGKTS